MQSRESFKLFLAKLQCFATDHNCDEPNLEIIKKPTTKWNIGNTSGDHPNTAEDDFRLKFNTVFDTVIFCFQDRFMQDDYEKFPFQEQIVLKAANG